MMGVLKGKTARAIFKREQKLKKKPYWGNHFWSRGYCVTTLGMDEEKIRRYVKYQEEREKQEEANARDYGLFERPDSYSHHLWWWLFIIDCFLAKRRQMAILENSNDIFPNMVKLTFFLLLINKLRLDIAELRHPVGKLMPYSNRALAVKRCRAFRNIIFRDYGAIGSEQADMHELSFDALHVPKVCPKLIKLSRLSRSGAWFFRPIPSRFISPGASDSLSGAWNNRRICLVSLRTFSGRNVPGARGSLRDILYRSTGCP